MNALNKIDSNVIEEIVSSAKLKTHTIPYAFYSHGVQKSIQIVVRRNMLLKDKLEITMRVVNGCFTGSKYEPYNKKEFFKIAILECFTNLIPDDSGSSLFDLVANTDIYNQVASLLPFLSEIEELVDDVIEFKKNEILCNQKDELTKASLVLNETIEVFSKLSKNFESVDLNKTMEIVQQLANKSESDIVDAILDRKDNLVEFPAVNYNASESTNYISDN